MIVECTAEEVCEVVCGHLHINLTSISHQQLLFERKKIPNEKTKRLKQGFVANKGIEVNMALTLSSTILSFPNEAVHALTCAGHSNTLIL
jgi:hypothetical protein